MATTGDSIGPWMLHEKLGVGGNATVWRASHEDGEVVALKLINKAQHEPYPTLHTRSAVPPEARRLPRRPAAA
jgi:serine/threonine protein kinase